MSQQTIDFGIDLGTTNSSIACCRDAVVRLFESEDGSTTTPSVVYLSGDGRLLVGRRARDAWVADPTNTQAEFKRWMGYSDKLEFPGAGRAMAAEELSAEVLKTLVADVRRTTQEEVRAAVITVPAAFGSLQCDATARGAKLAGLEHSPLLQEPIAAAIAYGASPSSRDKRWMVFDLGGGTLDIAVVSTRNGRLAVLDHQGDNRLGGKDFDRIIAEKLFLPPLTQQFALPGAKDDARAYERLMRGLIRKAEEAKIALSKTAKIDVELFDLGNDRDGKPIRASVTLDRAEVDESIRPLVDRCIILANRALEGARLSGADLDQILLVGGPTQMPIVRQALASQVSSRLDCSLDPMTVVARGAALYASTLEATAATSIGVSVPTSAAVAAGAVPFELSFERASGTLQSPVAGIFPSDTPVHEIKIDSEGGLWTSGWMVLQNAMFQVEVMLSDSKAVTKFNIGGRDHVGRPIEVSPSTFSIAYMLPMAAPPLPHTIAIELTSRAGDSSFDTVFARGCPLPAEARKSYRCDQTLKPSEQSATLPIKFWEIDVSEDPREKWWAGCVHIRADQIRRPIVEGSEIELTIKIDSSRKMTVEAFVPLLNQSFTQGVYLPDPPSARSQLQQQLDLCFARLDHVFKLAYETEREEIQQRARDLQLTLEHVAEQAGEKADRGGDPDADLGPAEILRKVRMQLAQLEEQLNVEGPSTLGREVRAEARWTDHVVTHCGTESDKTEMQRLRAQVDKLADANDERGLRWARQQLGELRGGILDHQPWFWLNVLRFLKAPGRHFVNQPEAERWLIKAEQAEREQNFVNLRAAVCKVWEMQTPDQVELSKQQAAQSGLRG